MLTQEELNFRFPKELNDKRYFLGYFLEGDKEVILVYDKFHSRVVYRGKSKSINDHKRHIKRFYGDENINKPELIQNPKHYEGL